MNNDNNIDVIDVVIIVNIVLSSDNQCDDSTTLDPVYNTITVVPGLPNKCVTPSSFNNARNAERPVIVLALIEYSGNRRG